jgi:hypothetical protein
MLLLQLCKTSFIKTYLLWGLSDIAPTYAIVRKTQHQSFSISYLDLIKLPYFADLLQRGYSKGVKGSPKTG